MFAQEMKALAEEIAVKSKGKIILGEVGWNRFADGFPNISIENAGALKWADVVYLSSMHSPDVIFEQLALIYSVPRYLAKSFKIVLPYFPTGTMERIQVEGEVATAHTLAKMLSATPESSRGQSQVIVFDLHTLQNQFYFSDSVHVRLKGCAALLLKELASIPDISNVVIAFPDEGAHKRFGKDFSSNFEIIICHKIRGEGSERRIKIKEGDVLGKHVVIVDDLVQSGGTMLECAKTLRSFGAVAVSGFVTHAIFPQDSWKKFVLPSDGGIADEQVFRTFWMTNSHPTANKIANIPPFKMLSLAPMVLQIIDDD